MTRDGHKSTCILQWGNQGALRSSNVSMTGDKSNVKDKQPKSTAVESNKRAKRCVPLGCMSQLLCTLLWQVPLRFQMCPSVILHPSGKKITLSCFLFGENNTMQQTITIQKKDFTKES